MTEPDTHSRLIGWLKIVLPLAALGILSTLFLVARTIDPENAIPYADVDVSERLAQPRMTDPTYAGVTDDGAALTVAATEARPEGASTAKLLVGSLETPDGGRIDLVAATGQFDTAARRVTLGGGVDITSSTGWRIKTDTLRAAMDKTDVETLAPVTATGPAGTVSANTMRLAQDGQDPNRYLLVFNGAVKLIYRPAQ